MYQIDLLSRTPVYEQIVLQTEQFVLKGILKPGDQLPSVRSLSLQLSVNPNTIAKAYGELERRGITVSAAGRGCFIRGDLSPAVQQYREKKLTEFRTLVRDLLAGGCSREDLKRLIETEGGINPHD
ncbi:MAG: GntR family transcriptional regulator [Lachnospiraceae bacterium]|nr:GntR family transcriptional regulator [Lachnospiraceae bacterium]